MAAWRKPHGAKMLAIFVVASTMGVAKSRLNSGLRSYICGNDCRPGSTDVNLWQCGISDFNAHELWDCFDNIGRNNIETLDLGGNELATLPGNIFKGMYSLTALFLDQNELSAVPGLVFEGLPSLVHVDLRGNPELRCVSRTYVNIVRVENQSIISSESCDYFGEETKPCLDSRDVDYRCAGHVESGILDLSSCGLTDTDLCGVEACFIAAYQMADITTINLDRNEFTASVVAHVQALLLPELIRPKEMVACAHPTNGSIPNCKPAASKKMPKFECGKPHISDRREGKREKRRLAETSVGNLGVTYDVHELGKPALENKVSHEESTAMPPAWDSSLCMSHWGRSEFLEHPDPGGYLIFVDGREQLGGNKYLVSDGLFFAKTLNRTLVEYPVKDSRVAPFGESGSGLAMYWDVSKLCMYHRMLDLVRFRTMVTEKRIPPENFVTIQAGRTEEGLTSHLHTEEEAIAFFEEYLDAQVIVMEYTWKSGIHRDALHYLSPNSFYSGVVQTLIEEQKDWAGGNFVALQWRTEWSTGNLTECYEEIIPVIEERRKELGFGKHQVLFNTDLHGSTSGTYTNNQKNRGKEVLERIERDYPAAVNNRLHNFVSTFADTGVRAIVAGLGVASSKVMIASSLNSKSRRHDPDAYHCQKVASGYVSLIVQWREELMRKPPSTVHRLFPLD